MEFNIKTRLPSGEIVRITELKNRDYFTILKFCENEDYEGLDDFFKKTIFKDLQELSILDKFYLLLFLRMLFIGSDITFQDKEKRLVKFDLDNILEKINLYDTDFVKVYSFDKFQIELGLPNLIYFKDINDIYTSIIKKVFINDKCIPFSTLSSNEKEDILANIPNQVFATLQAYVYDLSRNLSNFIIVEKNEDFNIEEINLNILSNGIISFILGIYSGGLSNFFDLVYVFTTTLKFNMTDFFNLTPRDSKVLLNIYKKEISKAKEQ